MIKISNSDLLPLALFFLFFHQTNSAIPRVNQSNRERRQELEAQWQKLQVRAGAIIDKQIPAYNKRLWEAGIGAIQTGE